MTEKSTRSMSYRHDELFLGSVLNQFENGAQMDLRMKFASQWIQSGTYKDPIAALDAARTFVDESEKRGLMIPIPEDSELNAPLRRQIERNARATVFQQTVVQRIAQEEAGPGIAIPLPGGAPPPPPNGHGRR